MKEKTATRLLTQEESDKQILMFMNFHFEQNDILKTERSVSKYLNDNIQLPRDASSYHFIQIKDEILSKDSKLSSLHKELSLLDRKIAALNMMRDICVDDIQEREEFHLPEITEAHEAKMVNLAKAQEETKQRLLKLALS